MHSTASTVTAVFSIYNPGESLPENIRILLQQVSNVIVVDDGSTDDVKELLSRLQKMGCQVLSMGKNSGIAAGLNAGIQQALSAQSSPSAFILTMDQDSTISDGYIASLLAAYDNARFSGFDVGMVAPGITEGLPTRSRGTKGTVIIGDEPIQSGLLIPVGTFGSLGLLMTELFIDGVDSEFYLRAKTAGLETIVSPEAKLGHSLGTLTPAAIFGRTLLFRGNPINVRTAATMRYYYIYRNRLILASMYWRREPLWVIRGMANDLRHLVLVTALAPGRVARLREVAHGVADGLRGKTGPKLPVS